LAVLEEPGLLHPPLEVLLTVNEESGMDGARGLVPGTLHGTTLINIDTEEWGHFYLGCAGGVDVEVTHESEMEDMHAGYVTIRMEVSGLRGGHSGIDIHLGRGNAIKLLAEALRDLAEHTDLRLIALHGGTARNAIPREAFAVCALRADALAKLDEWVQHRHEAWQKRFAQMDSNVAFAVRLEHLPLEHLPPVRDQPEGRRTQRRCGSEYSEGWANGPQKVRMGGTGTERFYPHPSPPPYKGEGI